MTTTLSDGLRNKILDAILNTGAGTSFDSGVLELRTGAAPGPNAADGGTLLASMTLPADAFGAAAAGSAAKAGTWQDAAADAAGTAAHFRMKQSGDAGGADSTKLRIEGSVTATGGGGDVTLDNVVIAVGQLVQMASFSISKPA